MRSMRGGHCVSLGSMGLPCSMAWRAARLAGLSRIDFQRVLAERDIALHYDKQELEHDIATLKDLGIL